jgi:hypothetical protein
VPPQLLTNICHVPDSELKQAERSSYIPHYNTTVNDEVDEDEHDVVSDAVDTEEAQLMSGGDVEDNNKMPIMSFRFTDLLTLSGSDNADSLMQIHS